MAADARDIRRNMMNTQPGDASTSFRFHGHEVATQSVAKAGKLSFWVCINLEILEVGVDCGFEFSGVEGIATCKDRWWI